MAFKEVELTRQYVVNTTIPYMMLCADFGIDSSTLKQLNSKLKLDKNCLIKAGTTIILPMSSGGSVIQSKYGYFDTVPFTLFGNPWSSDKENRERFSFEGCYFTLRYGNDVPQAWGLPVFPREYTDDVGANYSNVSIFGRSVDYQIYNGSHRTLSTNLVLHSELCSGEYIRDLIAVLTSACYPEYGVGDEKVGIEPPVINLVLGSQVSIEGVLTSCSASWNDSPIVDGKMVFCTLSLSITETAGPWDHNDIYPEYRGHGKESKVF